MYFRVSYPKIQCFDNNGLLAVGYEIYTYKAGTVSTSLTTYYNRDLAPAHANANPVVLDARGEADIYVGEAAKLVFTAPGGDPTSPIWAVDYVGEQQSNFVTGTATPVTANNNYVVSTTPAVSPLSNNFMLIMTPDIDNVDTIVSNVFTGTGINDCTASGPYIGSTSGSVFTIQIDGIGSPDTFKWKKDGGAWTTGVPITGAAQTLIEGVIVIFAVITGHTLNDIWAITVETPARVNLDGLGNLIVYKNKGGSVVALDGHDYKAGYPAQHIMNEALNAWLLINPATPIFSTPTITATRYRKNLTATYALLLADQGYELSCVGTFDVDLLTPPGFANKFVYVKNAGTGVITLDAGAYTIYGIGLSTYPLGPGMAVQLQSNGVDWHIITSTGGLSPIDRKDVTAVTSVTFSNLVPGRRYRLTGQLKNLVSNPGTCLLRFNADANARYAYANAYVQGSGAGAPSAVCGSNATSITLVTGVDADGGMDLKFEFETMPWNDYYVLVNGHTTNINSGQMASMTIGGWYYGVADLSSMTILKGADTFTGTLMLYQYG